MPLYPGDDPNLQGVRVEQETIAGVPINSFELWDQRGVHVANCLSAAQVEQVLERLSAGRDPYGRDG